MREESPPQKIHTLYTSKLYTAAHFRIRVSPQTADTLASPVILQQLNVATAVELLLQQMYNLLQMITGYRSDKMSTV
jgi:hypothetical protein